MSSYVLIRRHLSPYVTVCPHLVKDKKHFLDFADAWSAYNGDATLDGFITGFRLGARLVLDTFLSENQRFTDFFDSLTFRFIASSTVAF